MKLIIYFLALLFSSFLSYGQTRTITGRVIDENDLTPMPGVFIQTSRDTLRFGTTDVNGNFKIEVPTETDELIFNFIGMERTSIKLPTNCDNLEIIMMVDAIYDYVTVKTENKKRYKRFKELNKKHYQAYVSGTFTSKVPCFTYVFNKH